MRKYLALGITLASLLAPAQSSGMYKTTEPRTIHQTEINLYEQLDKKFDEAKEGALNSTNYEEFLTNMTNLTLYGILMREKEGTRRRSTKSKRAIVELGSIIESKESIEIMFATGTETYPKKQTTQETICLGYLQLKKIIKLQFGDFNKVLEKSPDLNELAQDCSICET